MEIWKDIDFIKGYEGLYRVSNMGRIYSKRSRKMLTFNQKGDYTGYIVLTLSNAGIQKSFALHRVIGLAFVSGYSKGKHINHKNSIKTDNRAENLEWVTPSQNVLHYYNQRKQKSL